MQRVYEPENLLEGELLQQMLASEGIAAHLVGRHLLGGTGGIMIGNVIKQQFLDSRDWPFGSVLSIMLTVAALAAAGLAALLARPRRRAYG